MTATALSLAGEADGEATFSVYETNGQVSGFLHDPQIGLIKSYVPLVESTAFASNVVISPHLINVRGTNLWTQKQMRVISSGIAELTRQIYSVFPDAFDFLFFFSAYRVERLPWTASENLVAGLHETIQVNYTGTGLPLGSDAGVLGSAGRLLGLNYLDGYERGVWTDNATHELLHQWASYTGTAIANGSHYDPRSNVGSLLGGYLWTTNGDGTFTLHCDEGASGAYHADPLDKYMMGLIPGSSVPMLRVYSHNDPWPTSLCGQVISNIESTVTIADIQGLYGVRSPGPATAQRSFSLGFVVESNGRFLNPWELTFYDILAEHYTKRLPPDYPDPPVWRNWVPIERFFGEGTRWQSDVLNLLKPRLGQGYLHRLCEKAVDAC